MVSSSSHKIICSSVLWKSHCSELSPAADILTLVCLVRLLMEKNNGILVVYH